MKLFYYDEILYSFIHNQCIKSIKILRDIVLKNYKNFTKFTKLIREFDSCDYIGAICVKKKRKRKRTRNKTIYKEMMKKY